MKRVCSTIEDLETSAMDDKKKKKKQKGSCVDAEEEAEETETDSGFFRLDQDLLFEILKHTDARSLATAACVCKQWYMTAQDERLWEMICTRHWVNIGCGSQQLRSVVLALGGFRKLHSLCLWPLLKPPTSSSFRQQHQPHQQKQSLFPFPSVISSTPTTHWGKDEVHLSLSLLSIRYYEKMNLNTNRFHPPSGVILPPPKHPLLEDSTR